MDQVLLDATIPRTLDALVREFSAPEWTGGRVEIWVFEDRAARQAAAMRLIHRGVLARVRSAYKPLVHAMCEEFKVGEGSLTIGVPEPAARFKLETFPLAGLLDTNRIEFVRSTVPMSYVIDDDEVFAPNRTHADGALSPCGWVRAYRAGDILTPVRDEPVETEYEQVFRAVMDAVARHDWGRDTPYFDTLEIAVAIPGIEMALDWHDEVVSTREALHEDLYFSLLEFFQRHAGRPPGDRGLQPGQIVPEIVAGEGDTRVRVTLEAHRVEAEPPGDAGDLDLIERPLTAGEIATALAALGGEPFLHRSVQGRAIPGLFRAGTGPGIAVTAGQHANETSGVVGALRAARRLMAETGMAFALVPQDNPDGYALHQRLRAGNPRHMHHAARYTALGDDLEARTAPPLHEKAARMEAIARSGAVLHLNLHGYPAHEWTRPLTGYLPRGFEMWSIPKGFFLILRHGPGLGAQAEPFLRALTARLADDPALAAFNAAQLAVWEAHAGAADFPVWNGIPCMVAERGGQPTPFQLITEYPDETIYGDAFRLAHTTQMRTVLEAAALVRAGMLTGP